MFRAWGIKDWIITFLTYGTWGMFLALRNSGFSIAKAASAGLSGAIVVALVFAGFNGLLMTVDKISVSDGEVSQPSQKSKPAVVQTTAIKKMPVKEAPTDVIEKKAVPTPAKVEKAQVTQSIKTAEVKSVAETPKVKEVVTKPVAEKPKVQQTAVSKKITKPKTTPMDEEKYQKFKIYVNSQQQDMEKLKKLQKAYPEMFQRLLEEKLKK